jgi:hypothetical protein
MNVLTIKLQIIKSILTTDVFSQLALHLEVSLN